MPAVSCADSKTPIPFEKLPAAAQQLINKHFATKQVALAYIDDEMVETTYKVTFNDGTKIEFDSNGEWTDIECLAEAVPEALVPQMIASYVAATYPQAFITELSRDRKGYEIKLSNTLELKFNKKFELIEIDD